MDEWIALLATFYCLCAFAIGVVVGSFLNVLIARLPYEKSILWPGSRCFACLRPIHPSDNLPIVGYLRLRGRCRSCGIAFSARYLWIELATGLAFAALFLIEVPFDIHRIAGIAEANAELRRGVLSPTAVAFFAYRALLVSLLIAAAVVDAGHRIIPPGIAYAGTAIGLFGACFLPWPWPSGPGTVAPLIAASSWSEPQVWGRIPLGLQPWPLWGPLPEWAVPGSWQLGLANGLAGALAGTFLVRAVKALFEVGLGKEALGMGDADLLMMAGAFLGWQPTVVAFFVGAFAALAIKLPAMVVERVRGVRSESELPFGPGLALGVIATWLGWRWIGPSVQFLFFDYLPLSVVVIVMALGMLVAGVLLRRKP